GCDPNAARDIDRDGHDKAIVVVGMLSNQVDASGRMKNAAALAVQLLEAIRNLLGAVCWAWVQSSSHRAEAKIHRGSVDLFGADSDEEEPAASETFSKTTPCPGTQVRYSAAIFPRSLPLQTSRTRTGPRKPICRKSVRISMGWG